MPTLRATRDNDSLTLLAVGSDDTEKPVVGWRRWRWRIEKRFSSGRRGTTALPAGLKVHLLGRLYAAGPARISLPDYQYVAWWLGLLAPGIGNVGDRVIAYLDHIGRVEGKITRIIDNGFAMSVGATARKRDETRSQLTWLANRDILNLPEDRRHDRIIPRNPIALLTLEDGTKMTCRIIDMSLSGAAIAAENRLR